MAAPAEKAKNNAALKGLSKEEKGGCQVRPCEGCKPIDPKNTQSSDFQDERYNFDKNGKRISSLDAPLRVMNFSKTRGWGCTVCARYEGSGPKK